MYMCPDEQVLSTYLDDELEEPWLSQIKEHLSQCENCRKRLESLKTVKEALQTFDLEDKKIKASQERTFKDINKRLFEKNSSSPKRRLLNLTKKKFFWPLVSAATTFCFCLIVLNPLSKKSNIIPYPDLPTILELDNIVPVRATDNYTTDTTLKNYSLEEILKYLNDIGYEVTLRNKKIEPLNIPQIIGNVEQLTSDVKLFSPPEKLEDPNSFNFKSELNEEDI